MLHVSSEGPFTRITMARTWFGRPIYTVSAYLIDGLLIDSGPPATARQLLAWCQGQSIRQVVNTHHHEDHSGGDALLQRKGLPVWASPATADILADFPRIELYRRYAWGQPRDVVVQKLGATVETDHYRFEVIPTPGHSPDHVVLFEPERRWLVSGDLYIHERARYLRVDEDIVGLLASLRRAQALEPEWLVCCHAGLVPDGGAALGRKIAYWESVGERAAELERQGLSARRIADRVLGREGLLSRISGGRISKINLIRALLA